MKIRALKIIGLLLVLTLANTFAYARDYNIDSHRLSTLSKEVENQENMIKNLSSRLSASEKDNCTLTIKCDSISKVLATINDSLNKEKQSRELSEAKSAKSLKNGFVLQAIVFIILICILTIVIAQIKGNHKLKNRLSNRQDQNTSDIEMLKSHLVDFDDKFLQTLMKEIEGNQGSKSVQPNHTLALKVADEVGRIETNLSKMDPAIRGYKQLQKSVERIKNYYLSQGYEIVDMLGKAYNEGMMVDADFAIDESLPEGSQIITSIKKPQVNYQGTTIQKATIIVSQNI